MKINQGLLKNNFFRNVGKIIDEGKSYFAKIRLKIVNYFGKKAPS